MFLNFSGINFHEQKIYFDNYFTFKVKETEEQPSASDVTEKLLFHHRSFEDLISKFSSKVSIKF